MRLRVSGPAFAEFEQTVEGYEAMAGGVKDRFLDAVEEAFNDILTNPERHPFYEGLRKPSEYRRRLVRGFPYLIVYRVYGDQVRVAAFAHASREPGYWERRS